LGDLDGPERARRGGAVAAVGEAPLEQTVPVGPSPRSFLGHPLLLLLPEMRSDGYGLRCARSREVVAAASRWPSSPFVALSFSSSSSVVGKGGRETRRRSPDSRVFPNLRGVSSGGEGSWAAFLFYHQGPQDFFGRGCAVLGYTCSVEPILVWA
jgi:hypothetical protein